MKYKNLVKIYKSILCILKADVIQYFFLIIVAFILYNTMFLEQVDISELLDITLVVSLLITFLITKLTSMLANILKKRLEEHLKLSTNYDLLVSKYPRCNQMIEYSNSPSANYKKGRRHTSSTRLSGKATNEDDDNLAYNKIDIYRLPVILELDCRDYVFREISDSITQYTLPEPIANHYEDIMRSHQYSKVYNQLNIRLDAFKKHNKEIELITSRTTYFDSLVTNRAMDFMWSYNVTNRELYSPGPFFEELEQSVWSNHLGINGFVESTDGDIIFVLRDKKASIGKGTIGTSVGASLKTKYVLDDNNICTCDGIVSGIKEEIKDELKINKTHYEFSLDNNIIAIYRDMIEGGKPQLLFHVKINITTAEVKKVFFKEGKRSVKDKEDKVKSTLIDGKKLVVVKREELENIYITPDILVINNKAYRAMPSVAASVVMLINYLAVPT